MAKGNGDKKKALAESELSVLEEARRVEIHRAMIQVIDELAKEQAQGSVVQVMGPVVDIDFAGALPPIENLLALFETVRRYR